MPRKPNFDIKEYVAVDLNSKKAKCLTCEKMICNRLTNIKRHFLLVHKRTIGCEVKLGDDEERSEELAKKPKLSTNIKIQIDKSEFLKCCVGL